MDIFFSVFKKLCESTCSAFESFRPSSWKRWNDGNTIASLTEHAWRIWCKPALQKISTWEPFLKTRFGAQKCCWRVEGKPKRRKKISHTCGLGHNKTLFCTFLCRHRMTTTFHVLCRTSTSERIGIIAMKIKRLTNSLSRNAFVAVAPSSGFKPRPHVSLFFWKRNFFSPVKFGRPFPRIRWKRFPRATQAKVSRTHGTSILWDFPNLEQCINTAETLTTKQTILQ